jgi:hypothetical protein
MRWEARTEKNSGFQRAVARKKAAGGRRRAVDRKKATDKEKAQNIPQEAGNK